MTQSWNMAQVRFDTNNNIWCRDLVQAEDPIMANVLAQIYGNSWSYCPTRIASWCDQMATCKENANFINSQASATREQLHKATVKQHNTHGNKANIPNPAGISKCFYSELLVKEQQHKRAMTHRQK